MSRRIVVFVGTDHHPFHRAVDWADSWQDRHVNDHVYIQYGSSRPPRIAEGASLVPFQEVATRIDSADVVVCHGGPGTIAQVRAGGHRPIVFPRDPARGEHVDGHQQLFARWCADKELADVVADPDGLDHLVRKLPAAGTLAEQDIDEEVAATVERFGRLVGRSPTPGRKSWPSRLRRRLPWTPPST